MAVRSTRSIRSVIPLDEHGHFVDFAAGTVLPATLDELEFHIGSGISHRWGDGTQSTVSIFFGHTAAYDSDDLGGNADARWPTDKPVDISITALHPIPAPVGLSAEPGDTQVTLSWADPGDDSITGYEVQQDGGGRVGISGSDASTTSYTVTGLTKGTQYTFQVRAVNNAGSGSASDRVIITVGRLTVWSATISTKELVEGGDVVVRAWSSVGNRYSGASLTCGRDTCNTFSYGGETYTIAELRNSIESKIHLIAFAAGTVLPKTLNEFEFHIGSGISYRWGDGKKSTESVPVEGTRVLKFDYTGAVYDLPSNADARWPTDKPVDISITAPRPVPAAPTGLSAASGNSEAALSWDDPDDSTITKYQYTQDGGTNWTDIPNSAPGGANAASYTVSGLTNGTEYTFAVRAVNSTGDGEASDSVSVTPATSASPSANNLPAFSAETTDRSVAENALGGTNVGLPVSATDADNEALTYSLTSCGSDHDSFTIDSDGQIKVAEGADLDHEAKSSYTVTVTAADISNATDEITVTITVTNVDEAGTVSFTSPQPQVGTILTVNLSDPDGSVSDVSWQWASSATVSETFSDLSANGAATASYTPQSGDVSQFLRATASYTDPQGLGKSAAAVSGNAVQEPAPAKPTGLTAAGGDESITLGWDDPGDSSITGYEYFQALEAKLTASDGAADDNFGVAVAVDGDTAVVGAYQDDDNGSDSGSAYVFLRESGTWKQVAKLGASDGFANDRFGYSVAADGETVVVGAYGDDGNGSYSGSAYVFSKPIAGWATATETAKLTASDGASDDNFGR